MQAIDYKAIANDLATRVGKPEARRLMVVEGVSPHTADKILGGRYDCEIGILVGGAIKRANEASKIVAS